MWQIGDIVECVKAYPPGVEEGELGAVVHVSRGEGEPIICWNAYNPIRHDSGGLVPMGHGWLVTNSFIRKIVPVDFGPFNIETDPIDSFLGV